MLRNVTLTAEERMIDRAREKARRERRTLNAAFREWLSRYGGATGAGEGYREIMRTLAKVSARRKFSRDELNER